MTIEELNQMIQEELKAYLNEEQTDEAYMEEGDDDVKVTTDEPAATTGEEALDLLRQIYDMIKPQVDDEGEEEEEEVEDEQADDEGEAEPEAEDAEEAEEEEEGDPEPEEEDLEEIFEAAGPSTEELVTLILSMGIPAAALAAAGGKSKLHRLISAAGSNVKKRVQAIRTFLADIPTGEVKGDDVEENLDRPNYKASDVSHPGGDAEKVKGGLNESVARFQKLANIKG